MTLLDLLEKPLTLNEQLAAYFKARPNVWIDGRELAKIAGFYAFRTRVSDCRRLFGMVIENRQRTLKTGAGVVTISEYRFVPSTQGDLNATV